MSIESRVENFFRGLVSQIPPPHKRSKSNVRGQKDEEGSGENGKTINENGESQISRDRKGSMKKVKARSASKTPKQQRRVVDQQGVEKISPSLNLEHVDDFPELPPDNSIIFARQNSGSIRKHQVPITITTHSDVPQWSDRFRQLRRSIQGRTKNSVSPQPQSGVAEKVALFEDSKMQSSLPPTPKPTPKQRSRSKVSVPQASPYDDTPTQPPIQRTILTVEASKVSTDTEQSDRGNSKDLKSAEKKRQNYRRSRSVVAGSSPATPITTHFPINNTEPVTIKGGKNFDPYGGLILSDVEQKSSHAESGYLSNLELSIPRSASVWSQTSPPTALESPPPTREIHREYGNSGRQNIPISQEVQSPRPPSRGTIFDRNASIRSKSRVSSPEPTRRGRLSSAKSESNLRRYERSNSSSWALDALKERVQETKYVTAVFESAKGGIAPVLTDIVKELGHWLGPRSRLLAVACEVHWSVPESVRSRSVEIRMKDELHRVLRQNNKRVLQLYDEREGSFPLSLIESKTEESCARDSTLDAFQGIYRRYYPELLSLQDAQTVSQHKSYWTLDTLGGEPKSMPHPSPARFLFRPNREILSRKSVVALNMAVLRMVGDDSDYERASMSSSIV